MFYNSASHIVFSILLYGIEEYIAKHLQCKAVALSPFLFEKEKDESYYCSLQFSKSSYTHYTITIATSHETVFAAIQQYCRDNISKIALRLGLLTKSKMNVVKTDQYTSINPERDESTIAIVAHIRDSTANNECCFTLYIPVDFFILFKIKKDDNTVELAAKDFENKLISFFNDPYNLFPSLPILLETMDDNELQKLIYALLNDSILTPYHLYLLITAFPQYALKIKYNISSNVITDVIDVRKASHNITGRDLYEGIYTFEEILFLRLKHKPYFHYGNFINHLQKIISHISIVSLFEKKPFEVWFNEMQQRKMLYTVLSQCDDTTIAAAFYPYPNLFSKLSHCLSSRRLHDIELHFNTQFNVDSIVASQYTLIQRYLEHITQFSNLYVLPFTRLLQRYVDSHIMYYVLFDVGWFTIATALKTIPKGLMLECIKKFPKGAQYCIIDVYNGVLNPNIVHDEMQIKKARNEVIASLIRLHTKHVIQLTV